MNKARFRLLVFFMSLSLIGIILVQLYWVNSSLKSSDDQFRFHVQHVLGKVGEKLEDQETLEFYDIYKRYRDSTGHTPVKSDLIYFRNRVLPKEVSRLNENSNTLIDSASEINNQNLTEKENNGTTVAVSKPLLSTGSDSELLNKIEFDYLYRDYRDMRTIEERVSNDKLKSLLFEELKQNDVTTPFEFAIFEDNQETGVKSAGFKYDKENTVSLPVFEEKKGVSRFRLAISFPQKGVYLFSSLIGITSLSLIFTMVILIAYVSALNQLIKQRQISEIKTDFINNMTHEFKTPIATINLALDSIKNPKIFEDKEKVQRYLQMIRDENKRMHAQVENVLQISKLEKKELDIVKDQADIHDTIDDAIEHVNLIIEARHGTLTRHFNAGRTTALLNDVHFTNVLVNILDNAIKYSPDEPVIDIYTENVKDFILIRITDKGLGMNKVTQKRIFEKFYREHTGDIHNVKGHGLGLAYVKRIVHDHNSHIYVESEKGKGSSFIIKMPLIN